MTGFAQSMIDAMARVARREIRDARMATAGWGTVTSATPLAVVLDEGSGAPMTATPAPLVAGLATGDRVWVEIAGNRAVIVGRAGGQASVPSGSVTAYAGETAPVGWLSCEGQAVPRTDYADLFAAIGTTYGAGNGSTTFNVPNLVGRIPVGRDVGQTEFDVLGETGGAKTHTLTLDQMPAHAHQVGMNAAGTAEGTAATNWAVLTNSAAADGTQTNQRQHLVSGNPSSYMHLATRARGGGGAHPNLQPYLVLNYIIKA